MPLLTERRRAALRHIFIGSQGIRAGWSICLFVLAVILPSSLLNLILHLAGVKHYDGGLTAWRLLLGEAVSFAFVMLATWIMARVEKRKLAFYGYAWGRPGLQFTAGWAGGFLSLSLLIAALAAGGFLVFTGLGLHGPAIFGYGLVWLAAFALVGCLEESLFRGYIQATLARGMGFWPAALVMSLLFGAAHIKNKGESVTGIAEVVVAGLVFCLLLRVSKSLWMGIGYHGAWDWAQSYFYGTPDSGYPANHNLLVSHATGNPLLSGGTAGPEGSALSPIVMIAGLLVLVFLCRRAGMFAAKDSSFPEEKEARTLLSV